MKNFWIRFLRGLGKWADHPGALWLLAFLAALDLFVLVVPTDVLVVVITTMKPTRWFKNCLFLVTGSAVGALCLALTVQWIGAPSFMVSQDWSQYSHWILAHGAWALFGIALSPLPQQPSVAIAAAAGIPIGMIFLSIWVGRFIKYFIFAWLAAKMPYFFTVGMGRKLGLAWAFEALEGPHGT